MRFPFELPLNHGRFDKLVYLARRVGLRLPSKYGAIIGYGGRFTLHAGGDPMALRSHQSPIDTCLFWDGLFGGWERTQLALWAAVAPEADLAIDIGANSGIYSLISGSFGTRTWAFEPAPAVFDILAENVALNGFPIRTHPVAVGEGSGRATLFLTRPGWSDTSSLDSSYAKERSKGEQPIEWPVDLVCIDDLFRSESELAERICVKLDIEGEEPRALEGMRFLLNDRSVLLMTEALDHEAFDLVAKSVPSDYGWMGIDDREDRLVPVDEFRPGCTNYLACRPADGWSFPTERIVDQLVDRLPDRPHDPGTSGQRC